MKRLSDSNYEHLCSIGLGIAMLFRFIGYDIASFIVESLLHSGHERDPDAVINHAGYYGQAIKEVFGCLAVFAVPTLLHWMTGKWALVFGSSLFTIYFASFFYLHTALFFAANVVLGLAYTLSYAAIFAYQVQYSRKETLGRNTATVWSIAQCSLMVGGGVYIYVGSSFATNGDAHLNSTMNSTTVNGTARHFRYYSEQETRWLCGVLTSACALSVLLMCLLPNRKVAESADGPKEQFSAIQQLGSFCSVLVDRRVLIFIPRFVNQGLFVSLYMNIYPTTLQYSFILSQKYPMLTAYYSFCICAGATICGFATSRLNRRFHDFGFRPLYYITIVVQLVIYFLMILTVPNWSTARPTEESALLEPHLCWVILVSFLLGFGSTANISSFSVFCARLIPDRASHVFSAGIFYFGVASALVFFCMPLLSMRAHASILAFTTVLAALTFNVAWQHIEKSDKIQPEKSMQTITSEI